ncbi:MAG: sigma-70 family RNA polymerase sigma factor [Planctomycetota bacterium]|jgi:RNA polymerase sigma-70 factor (ECF subfamily)|nr:sigma-70 family RNA polymerase sigma factor [Planctomycetota bacterium]
MADPHEAFLRQLTPVLPELRAFVGSCLRDPAGCDDVVQETTIVLWRRSGDYDPTRSFGAWARGIAVRVLKARLRQGARWRCLDGAAIDAICTSWDQRDGEHPREDELQALRACVRELPADRRDWLRLRYEQGLDFAAIAERLGKSAQAIQRAVHRLRETLATCIRRRLSEGS